ncbi:JHBP [Nesidiocoris tenuis]|uniref:JHBP n=1 Tax=Nesidiocoris tenuis TaxID=355587 RepID=A0ABN7B1X6_9HEMI|nr:JHBP [Nesidiocoris tenuis]
MKSTARYTIVSLLVIGLASSAKLPKTWKTCKQTDKNANECLRAAAEHAVRSMKNGNRDLGVLPLDPLHFNHLSMDGGNGPVNVQLDLKNLDMYGISTAKVQRIKADWDNYLLEGDITFGRDFVLLGDYSVKGRVLLLPVVGEGKCNLTFQNFVAHLSGVGRELIKGKNRYMEIEKLTVGIETSRFIMNLENLFNGNKALSDNMNLFINQNWQEILQELRPSISKAFGEGFRQVANQVFTRLPLDVIAPK